jgi:tyrosyl-tRNA synthetase
MAENISSSRFSNDEQRSEAIHELTTRGVARIYPSADGLVDALESGTQLKAYMGIDPTSPDMHVGHQSQLRKLKRLQDLGHNVTLLIGDFTAMIGDPTDKSAARVKLSRDQVLENAQSYKSQAGKIIDFEDSKNPAELRYNSEWLQGMDFADVLELASEFSVQQMLERDMFRKRIALEKPVGLHEFMYPLMQGWDSVQLDIDIELGGSDQIFNMLVGTDLVKRHLRKQKFIIAGNLLVDPSGKKIGKTEGNMITMTDTPLDMFHKIMLWGDQITPHALELCTEVSMAKIREITELMESGELSGYDAKVYLAHTVVSELHNDEAADEARELFYALTRDNNIEAISDSITECIVNDGDSVVSILVASGLASSNSDARRLLESGAVRINSQKVDADWHAAPTAGHMTLGVGKKKIENMRVLKFAPNNEQS